MAIVNEVSTQLALTQATPKEFIDTSEWGVTSKRYFDHTRAAVGDANSTVDLIDVPAGRVRIVMPDFVIANSAFGAARTMEVGHTGYTDKDGTVVAADDDAFDTAVDVSAAATTKLDTAVGADPTMYFNTRSGFTIQVKIENGTSPAAATLKGYVGLIHL